MSFLAAIPVYNEQNYARHAIEQVMKYATDVLVIDDGSTDGTSDILRRIPGLHLVSHRRNLGYGQTLIGCFAFAIKHGYNTIVTLDCDLQHDPRHILDFVHEAGNVDIVSGSRYLPDSQVIGEPPPDERLQINRTITARIREITGYDIADAFCGYKAYRTQSLHRLRLDEPGYAMPLQLWIQAWRAGLTVKELPVDLIYRDLSRSFVGSIADAQRRLAYYDQIIDRELARE